MAINYFEIPEGASAKIQEVENGRYVVRYSDAMCNSQTLPRNTKFGWTVYDLMRGGEDYSDAERAQNINEYTYDKQTAERIAKQINDNAPTWMR